MGQVRGVGVNRLSSLFPLLCPLTSILAKLKRKLEGAWVVQAGEVSQPPEGLCVAGEQEGAGMKGMGTDGEPLLVSYPSLLDSPE